MSSDAKKHARLRGNFSQAGRLEWIGLSPGKRQPIQVVQQVELRVGTGLVGDRHARKPGSKRQVSLIQQEHLPVVAAFMGTESVRPEQLRRNLVVSGINLLALIGQRFWVGSVLLEGVEPCDPCERMEEALGQGGFNAMEGHGGLIATVQVAGSIALGDPIRADASEDAS
jgi:MOSC domain-containing protein YiiM